MLKGKEEGNKNKQKTPRYLMFIKEKRDGIVKAKRMC